MPVIILEVWIFIVSCSVKGCVTLKNKLPLFNVINKFLPSFSILELEVSSSFKALLSSRLIYAYESSEVLTA